MMNAQAPCIRHRRKPGRREGVMKEGEQHDEICVCGSVIVAALREDAQRCGWMCDMLQGSKRQCGCTSSLDELQCLLCIRVRGDKEAWEEGGGGEDAPHCGWLCERKEA
jgi:hypothetical protein